MNRTQQITPSWTPQAPAIATQLEALEGSLGELRAALPPLEAKRQQLREKLLGGDVGQVAQVATLGAHVSELNAAIEEAQRRVTLKRAEHDAALEDDKTQARWDDLAALVAQFLASEQALSVYDYERQERTLTERGKMRVTIFTEAIRGGLLRSVLMEIGERTPQRIPVSEIIGMKSERNMGTLEPIVSITPNSRDLVWQEIQDRRHVFLAALDARGVDGAPLFGSVWGDNWIPLDALEGEALN